MSDEDCVGGQSQSIQPVPFIPRFHLPCASTAPCTRTAPAANRADRCLVTARTRCLRPVTLLLLAYHPRPSSTLSVKAAVVSPRATAPLSLAPALAEQTRPEVLSRQKG